LVIAAIIGLQASHTLTQFLIAERLRCRANLPAGTFRFRDDDIFFSRGRRLRICWSGVASKEEKKA
jgi:hypothetical protein